MRLHHLHIFMISFLAICFCCANGIACPDRCTIPNDKESNLRVKIDRSLLNHDVPETLGLKEPDGLETITVFHPLEDEDMNFNNHPQLVEFKGKLYATWVGHPRHEPSPESWVYYSFSEDGKNWEKPRQLGPDKRASGGWITDGNTLGCLLISLEYVTVKGKAYKTSCTEVMWTEDGQIWSEPQKLMSNAAPSESARRLADGRFLMVCHGLDLTEGSYGKAGIEGVRETKIMFTDSKDGKSGWKEAELPDILPFSANEKEKVARPMEASWYQRDDGIIVMLFRDIWYDAKRRTWKVLYALSYDNGSSWTKPSISNILDSDSMQCAGSFNGKAYFVNNPVPHRRRVPLTISVSLDGEYFNRIYLLRGTPPKRRYEGISKTEGYSYPGSCIWNGHLYVAYATNKEDIEISRIPLSSL